jgi:hypothetical protein
MQMGPTEFPETLVLCCVKSQGSGDVHSEIQHGYLQYMTQSRVFYTRILTQQNTSARTHAHTYAQTTSKQSPKESYFSTINKEND